MPIVHEEGQNVRRLSGFPLHPLGVRRFRQACLWLRRRIRPVEVNFTLPPMTISDATWHEVLGRYEEIAGGVIKRALACKVPGIVLEFELLPPMADRPEWGAEITAIPGGTWRRPTPPMA